MNILIIPSWYPNSDNSTIGNIYKEQASLLVEDGFSIKILMGKNNVIKKSKIENIKSKVFKKKLELSMDYLIQNPDAFSFPIVYSEGSSEEDTYNNFCKCYRMAYAQLINDGWIPDVIHAQSTVDGGLAAYHLGTRFNIPYVITEHQTFSLLHYSNFKRERISTALLKASKVAAVSNHQKRGMLMNNIFRDIDIIWNYIDDEKFTLKEVENTQNFIISTITYPNKIKDPETFFKAISMFSKMDINSLIENKVLIVGNGSLKKTDTLYFENMAKEHGIYELCIFIPNLNKNEIVKMLKESNVFVSTSVAETFGIAVREAMLCGTTVISTKSGGVEDTLTEETSVLVNVGDYESIANQLIQLKLNKLNFNKESNRKKVIDQSGKLIFIEQMNKFYNC